MDSTDVELFVPSTIPIFLKTAIKWELKKFNIVIDKLHDCGNIFENNDKEFYTF
jgi:hypothetical protein